MLRYVFLAKMADDIATTPVESIRNDTAHNELNRKYNRRGAEGYLRVSLFLFSVPKFIKLKSKCIVVA